MHTNSFISEIPVKMNQKEIMNMLGIKPGSVSPFGLLNDKEKKVKFFFDQEFMEYEIVNFHVAFPRWWNEFINT